MLHVSAVGGFFFFHFVLGLRCVLCCAVQLCFLRLLDHRNFTGAIILGDDDTLKLEINTDPNKRDSSRTTKSLSGSNANGFKRDKWLAYVEASFGLFVPPLPICCFHLNSQTRIPRGRKRYRRREVVLHAFVSHGAVGGDGVPVQMLGRV